MKETNSTAVDTTATAPKVKQPSWFQRKVVPFMGKLGNQRHLAAIRDSFGTLIPLIIAGAIGILVLTIGFGGWGSQNVSVLGWIFMATHWEEYQALPDGASITLIPDWNAGAWDNISTVGATIFGPLNSVSLGIMSIYISFLMGYFVAVSRNHKSPILVGFAAFATFAILINVNTYFVSANGLLIAILGGIAGAELFMVFTKVRALEIRLPDGVPPAVGKSFAVFLPMLFTLVIVSIFNTCIWGIAKGQAWEVTASNVSVFSMLTVDDAGKHILTQLSYYELVDSAGKSYAALIQEGNYEAANTLFDETGYAVVNQALAKGYITSAEATAASGALDGLRTIYDTAYHDTFVATSNDEADAIIAGVYNDLANSLNNAGLSDAANDVAINQILFATNGAIDFATIGQNWVDTLVTFDPNTEEDAATAAATSIAVFHYTSIKVPTGSFGAGALLFMTIQAPFMGLATSDAGIWIALLFVFLVSFLWFFGIHGSNVMAGIFEPIWLAMLATNVSIFQSVGDPAIAQDLMSAYAKPFFDSYMYIGGSGATLALILGVLIFSKKRELREVSKYAAPAGIFQINEPVIFGFPIVLNFVWFVPFILAPMITLAWAAFGVMSGLVYPSYIATPWTAPWFVGALLSNGLNSPFWSMFFAVGALVIAFLIYFPFVLIDNAQYDKKRRESGNASPEEIALWEMQSLKKQTKDNVKFALEGGEISKDESEKLLLQAKADYDELMPILTLQYKAWKMQDELAYKEKLAKEKEEYKQLKLEIKKTDKEAKEAKKLEKQQNKDK